MSDDHELRLSNWIVEAARAQVLAKRGRSEAASRAKQRAEILEKACKEAVVATKDEYVDGHAAWMDEVAGPEAEGGGVAAIFLQRLAMYVNAHAAGTVDEDASKELIAIGEPDLADAFGMLSSSSLPPPPPPEWPEAPRAKADGPVQMRFALIGDPHVGSPHANQVLESLLAHLSGQADAAVLTGDLTQNGADSLFAEAKQITDRSEIPVLTTLGNHDMWGGGTVGTTGLSAYRSLFGSEPRADEVHAGVRIIVLNSAHPAASPFPPFDLMGGVFRDAPGQSVPGGKLSSETIEWMDSIEPSDHRTFVVLHHPPFPYLGFPPVVFGLDEAGTEVLRSLSERVRASAIFCGHTHRSALTELGGVPVIEVPCCKEWPFGFGMVEVAESGWSYNLEPVPDPPQVDSGSADVLFRRYARGPQEARAFSASF